MELLKAAYTNDWSQYELTEADNLEPLELSKSEENVVIARIKKLARDPDQMFPNALALVHKGYQEQEWERQSSIGDLVRPSPSDRNAWEQYEKFIQLAVKLLAKYRGIKGDWRTDRFNTVTTNHRASMGSEAAARVKESFVVKWESLADLNIICESYLPGDSLYKNDCILETGSFDAVGDMIAKDLPQSDYFVADGYTNNNSKQFVIYNSQADIVDTVVVTKHANN